MVLPVVGQALVEVGVVFFGDFFLFFHPDGLVLVEFLEFGGDFLNFLGFLLFLLIFFDFDVFGLLFLLLLLFIV
jgi:hypothetical protein